MATDQEPSPPAGSPAWWASRPEREEATGGRGRPSLPFDRIIAAAVELVDEVGPDAFGMRMLAERLESGTATLYRHVASKDEILAYVVDRVLGEGAIQRQPVIEVPELTWKSVCMIAAETLYHTLNKHPGVIPLLLSQIPLGPNGLKARERAISTFLAMGLSPELSARAYTTIAHYVIGFSSQQLAGASSTHGAGAELRQFFENLDAAAFPATVRLAEHLADIPLDEEFRFGLKLIIDGLELTLSAQGSGASSSA